MKTIKNLNIPSYLNLTAENASVCADYLASIDNELSEGKTLDEVIHSHAPDAPEDALDSIKKGIATFSDKFNKIKSGRAALAILEEDSKLLSPAERFRRDLNLLTILSTRCSTAIISEEDLVAYSDYLDSLNPDAINNDDFYQKISTMEQLIVEHDELLVPLFTNMSSSRTLMNNLTNMSAEDAKAYILDGEHSRETLAAAIYIMAANDELDVKVRRHSDLASTVGAMTAAAVEADLVIKSGSSDEAAIKALCSVSSALILAAAVTAVSFLTGFVLYSLTPLTALGALFFGTAPLMTIFSIFASKLHGKLKNLLFRPVFNTALGVHKMTERIRERFSSHKSIAKQQRLRANVSSFFKGLRSDISDKVKDASANVRNRTSAFRSNVAAYNQKAAEIGVRAMNPDSMPRFGA